MRPIAVLGGTSGLGLEVIRHLAARGYEVRAGYRRGVSRTWSGSVDGLTWVDADLEYVSDFGSRFAGCEVLVWLAHRRPANGDLGEIRLNVEPFEHCCRSAARWGVRRIVFVSSGGSVYGHARRLPIEEEHPRCPLSDYGKAKLAMESAAEFASAKGDVEIAILRPGNLYGQDSGGTGAPGLIGELRRCIAVGSPLALRGSGNNIRDFVHVSDVAHAVTAAVESPSACVIWNVATGVGHSVFQVLEMVCSTLGRRKLEVREGNICPTDVSVNVLSTDRIRSSIQWTPMALEIGLRRVLARLLVTSESGVI